MTLLLSLTGLAGCGSVAERRTETVTPAPIPSPEATPTDADGTEAAPLGRGATLLVRNETAIRQSLIVRVKQDETVLFERSATVLGGRGVTYEGVLPRTYGLTGDNPTTVVLRTLAGQLVGTRAVAVSRSTRLIVASLVRDGVEWVRVD